MSKTKNDTFLSNIVDKESLRRVQKETLQCISDAISLTQGPAGGSTMLMHNDRVTEYSKDGKKVLNSIKFFKPLPNAIHDELISITDYVVKKVGDGTTEAVIMSNLIFRGLCDYQKKHPEVNNTTIINDFKEAVQVVSDSIRENTRDLTVEDIHDICMISTNGNTKVSDEIAEIYKTFGTDVYIELGTTNTTDSLTKVFDGISINKGCPSPAFINNDKGTVEIRDAHIYYFTDPVDTPEMINLFEAIFYQNIYEPYSKNQAENYVPTVIMVPSISRDLQSELADIEKIFYSFDQHNATTSKPPFAIISGLNDRVDNIEDITMLCGCPSIRKYINPDVQAKDIEEGNAPTKETITQFCGHAEAVEISIETTKFINPQEMYSDEVDEDGNRQYSNTYAGLVAHLTAELKLAQEDNTDINLIGNLKRRLNHLKANFVQYLIGGVAAADRDNVRDLAEDAILNCRSAAINGVGYGAGFEGLRATTALLKKLALDEAAGEELPFYAPYITIIAEAYDAYSLNLYLTVYSDMEEADAKIDDSLTIHNKPMNLRTQSFYGDQVLCSIESEPEILHAVSSIIGVMFSANQALLIDPMQNTYLNTDED